MRQCEKCGNEFKSGNSYRVHYHRFHRPPEQSIPVQQEPMPEPKAETESVTTEQRGSDREISKSSGGDDLGGLLAIGGAVAGLILLLLFGGKKQ